MKKVFNYFEESFFLIIKYWQIYLVVVLFSAQYTLESITKIPIVFSLILSLIHLGWFGAKFELLYAAIEKQPLPWNQSVKLIFKYIKKLLPLAILFFLISSIFLTSFLFSYGKWFLKGQELSQNKQVRTQQLESIFISLKSQSTLEAFSTSLNPIAIVFQLVPSVFFLTGAILLSVMVVNNLGILHAMRTSLFFAKKNLFFFFCVFTLHLIFVTVNGNILSLLFIDTFSSEGRLLTFLTGIPFHFAQLLLTAAVLLYYVKQRKI